jgi:hypothetical protein
MTASKFNILLILALLLGACQAAPAATTLEAIPTATTVPATAVSPTTAPSTVAPTTKALPEPEPAAGEGAILHTAIGDFQIGPARFVDEIHGNKPAPGEKILLLTLTGKGGARLEPENLQLEAFQTALHDVSNGEIHLEGDDGSYSISSMAGWVDSQATEFAIGFRVPAGAKTFQLFWPENEPIDIVPINLGLTQLITG